MIGDSNQRPFAHAAAEAEEAEGSSRLARTSFYGLSLASQMIVWAVRRRLHRVSRGVDDTEVAEAFGVAGLGSALASLMQIVDLLLCGASDRIHLHSVSCPSLAPHEACVLNSLAHLQHGGEAGARRSFGAFLGTAMFRLALPGLRGIADELTGRGFDLSFVDAAVLPGLPAPSTTVH